eukprot:scaffold2919_cov130-Skeletonema_menzelii.AAC.5
MSADKNDVDTSSCASCGIAGNGDIKLKKCTACYLVRYCSIKCQKDHRPKHKRDCKKRVVELHDELLFKQPKSTHRGDCPICLVPLPLDLTKSTRMSCCSKLVCNGCYHANERREKEQRLAPKCPFCRHDIPRSPAEADRNKRKRIEANDPDALTEFGTRCREKGDYKGAIVCWTKAAELGDVEAHYQLSCSYRIGNGVEKDKKKEVHHLEQAAIKGDPQARYNLGTFEWERGEHERAVKHWIIAAKLGDIKAVATLKDMYKRGLIGKEDFAAALRAHQATLDATKSPQREEAEEYFRNDPDLFY